MGYIVGGAEAGQSAVESFVRGQIDTALAQVDQSQSTIKSLTSSITALLAAAPDGQELFDDIEFDVDKPNFDASALESIEPPEDIDIDIDSNIDITFNPPNTVSSIRVPNVGSKALLSVEAPMAATAPVLTATAPADTFTFNPENYVSGLLTFTQQKIREALAAEEELIQINVESNVSLDGNTSDIVLVDNNIEQAIYDRATSRMLDEEAKAIFDTERTFQSRGFAMPVGALNAQLDSVRKASLKSREDLNNDILKSRIGLEQKRTEYELQRANSITDAQYKHDTILSQLHSVNVEYIKARAQNRGIYIEAAVKLESVLADIHKTKETLKMEAEKLSYQGAIEIYNSQVSSFKQLMEAYKIENEVSIAATNARIAYNKGVTEIYSTDVNASKVYVEAQVAALEEKKVDFEVEKMSTSAQIAVAEAQNSRWQSMASVYESSVKAFAAKINAAREAETLDLERYRIETAGVSAEVQARVMKASAQLEAAMKKFTVSIDVLKNQSTIAGNIISSALNSVNTGASYGFSGGLSGSTTFTNSESTSFSYLGETSDMRDAPH